MYNIICSLQIQASLTTTESQLTEEYDMMRLNNCSSRNIWREGRSLLCQKNAQVMIKPFFNYAHTGMPTLLLRPLTGV